MLFIMADHSFSLSKICLVDQNLCHQDIVEIENELNRKHEDSFDSPKGNGKRRSLSFPNQFSKPSYMRAATPPDVEVRVVDEAFEKIESIKDRSGGNPAQTPVAPRAYQSRRGVERGIRSSWEASMPACSPRRFNMF